MKYRSFYSEDLERYTPGDWNYDSDESGSFATAWLVVLFYAGFLWLVWR